MTQLFVVIVLYCVSATPCIISLNVVIVDGRVDGEAGVQFRQHGGKVGNEKVSCGSSCIELWTDLGQAFPSSPPPSADCLK